MGCIHKGAGIGQPLNILKKDSPGQPDPRAVDIPLEA